LVARQGLSVSEAAGRLGIGPNLIRKWKKAQEQGLGRRQLPATVGFGNGECPVASGE
jgi:transposase-like protein